jgi:hypothetical protein
MKRFVLNEWGQAAIASVVIAFLTLIAVGVTETGAGGMQLFAIGFMAITIAIKRASE